jgi:hypothetical protein
LLGKNQQNGVINFVMVLRERGLKGFKGFKGFKEFKEFKGFTDYADKGGFTKPASHRNIAHCVGPENRYNIAMDISGLGKLSAQKEGN